MTQSLEQLLDERNRAAEALEETRDQLRAVLDAVPGCVMWVDDELNYRGINQHMARFFDLEPAALIGRKVGCLGVSPEFTQWVGTFFESAEMSASSEVAAVLHGEDRTLLIMAQKYQQGRAAVFVAVDITARKLLEGQLVHDTLHDRLTGIANRSLFMDRLQQACSMARRDYDRRLAVLYLDFDRFKLVNDSLGHAAGDLLLVAMARRLEGCLRPGDTVARLGGDEFGILLDGIDEVSEAIGVADRLRQELAQPFDIADESGQGRQAFVTISIGIAQGGGGYDDPEKLLRDADTALYRAKARGRACFEVYDAEMQDLAQRRSVLLGDLRQALEKDEFCLYYQPLVALPNQQIVGFEALLRWRHPKRGMLLPAEFISIADEAGLMVTLDHWVLREACRQLNQWQALRAQYDIAEQPFRLSVNCCERHFAHPQLGDQIEAIIAETGAEPTGLMIETTENVLIDHCEIASRILDRLRLLGVQVCVDDFGTGYTSLSYLHRLPIDVLKIDRSFLKRMTDDARSLEMLHAVVALADNLAIDVVAEGIESQEQLLQLDQLGEPRCGFGQGYYFSGPITGELASLLLTGGRTR